MVMSRVELGAASGFWILCEHMGGQGALPTPWRDLTPRMCLAISRWLCTGPASYPCRLPWSEAREHWALQQGLVAAAAGSVGLPGRSHFLLFSSTKEIPPKLNKQTRSYLFSIVRAMLWAQAGFCVRCAHLQPCCAGSGGQTVPFTCSNLTSKSDGKDPALKPPLSILFLSLPEGAEPHHLHGKHWAERKQTLFSLSGLRGDGRRREAPGINKCRFPL